MNASNRYKVSRRQWAKWSPVGRGVFNALMASMVANQELYRHSDDPPVPKAIWRVTAWNAAFMAASEATRIAKAGKDQ